MKQQATQRSSAIDTVRGIAILLVLIGHMPWPSNLPGWLQTTLAPLQRGGWIGVDLFFVLSGFLVSGLLFREYQQTKDMQIGRFLIRRGFKIYPAFYLMVATVFIWAAVRGKFPGWSYVASEALFYQNYGLTIFPHTWSLAVEEHFYLTLPLLLWWVRGSASTPFRTLPIIIGSIAVTVLALRLLGVGEMDASQLAQLEPNTYRRMYTSTHLRCDALFFGVFLSWLYHFRPTKFERLTARPGLLLGGGLLLLTPAFIFPLSHNPHWFTIGFTAMYLGAGALLASFVRKEWSFRPLAKLGFYSYSVYLWHIPLKQIVMPWLFSPDPVTKRPMAWIEAIFGAPPAPTAVLVAYFILTIVGGILLAWIIEIPMLRLRDRLTAAKSHPADHLPTPLSSTAKES